jgi:hypothetical protein
MPNPIRSNQKRIEANITTDEHSVIVSLSKVLNINRANTIDLIISFAKANGLEEALVAKKNQPRVKIDSACSLETHAFLQDMSSRFKFAGTKEKVISEALNIASINADALQNSINNKSNVKSCLVKIA